LTWYAITNDVHRRGAEGTEMLFVSSTDDFPSSDELMKYDGFSFVISIVSRESLFTSMLSELFSKF
jgi:hypothetical protein